MENQKYELTYQPMVQKKKKCNCVERLLLFRTKSHVLIVMF